MSQWDIQPDEVDAVLTTTAADGNDLVTAIGGANSGAGGDDLGQLALDAQDGAQSAIIGAALWGFLEDQMPAMVAAITRIQGMITGTGQAKNAIVAGDEAMAVSTSAIMSIAVASGNFSPLIPDEGK